VIEIPGYSIKREIGQGGMASVYLAVQTSLDREVALKVMSPALAADPAFTRRFLQEARMLASLAHPNIVQVFDVGVTNNQMHYFSMQYLANGDFVARVQRGLAESELKRVLGGIANALGYAHQRGYVHRDVAPGNILFDANDNPVLTDFGIALAATQGTRITSTGFSVGTSHYMSPEQARGGDIDARSDLYSLGILTWYGLTGSPPYDGADGFAVAYAHVFEPVPTLPPEKAHWQGLIDKALAKDPKDRFADVGQFTAALDAIAVASSSGAAPTQALPLPAARPVTPRPTTPKPAAERPATPPPAAPKAVTPRPAPAPRVAVVKPAPAATANASGGNTRALMMAVAVIALLGVAGIAYLLWPTGKPGKPAAAPSASSTPAAPAPTAPAGASSASGTSAVASAPPVEPGQTSDNAGAASGETPAEGEAEALDLNDLPTVLDPVQELVRLGRADLLAQRYSTPPGINALERFRLALRIDPKDKSAKQGIVDTARAYLALADKARAANDNAGLTQQLAKAEEIAQSQLPEAKPVLDEVAQRRSALAAPWLEKAAKAAADWDKTGAKAAYDEALAVDPENEAAKEGIKKLAAIGAPGYAFRDKLADGSNGPEMVVMAGGKLAAGHAEVSRAEFQRFWSAAGARQFGGKEFSCRDRESFFRGSKKRDWQNPDVKQDASHPVVCVSWDEAAAYAKWLGEQTGRRYRLLGNAEWDQLARTAAAAGCGSANLADADFAKAYDSKGEACSDGYAGTAPVGHYPAAGGFVDVDGNVREWVDACGNGAAASAGCRDHRFRGRAWLSSPDKEQVGYAESFGNDVAANSIGLRVAREVDQK
jgi:formylglycine-generating enzyme required for sulfatase activity